ncbi:MAG: FAD-binding and (Fe-S)-binding domain-containing protein [Phycisphaeraceae bacterium]
MTATLHTTSPPPTLDAAALERALRGHVRGDISFDTLTRGLHSTDASHYQIMPACVVWPRDADDAATAVRIAGEHHCPVTPRGGATSLSGQTTWTGMVLDCSRYMDGLLEVNVAEQWARVGPGMIRDQLNNAVKKHKLHFAPDPATGDRATVGGMIGNNSSGTHSIVHGKTVDHVLECTVALADGTVLTLGPETAAQWSNTAAGNDRAAEIHRRFQQIIDDNRDEITRRFPKVMRRVSGYNLDRFLHDIHERPWNLAELIVGSEGTLGALLEAKIKLSPLPEATSVVVVHFDDLLRSLEAVSPILEHHPAAVEILDKVILDEAKKNRSTARLAADFIEGAPDAVLIVEFFGDTNDEVADKAERLADNLRHRNIGYAHPIRTVPDRQQNVWKLRKLALGLASNVPGPRKRQAFVEDACVPVEVLPEYIGKVLDFCKEQDAPVSLYGHASVGVIHLEPMLDLHLEAERQKMRAISERVFELVCHYQGSWSGEHGDGIVRGGQLQRFFGDQIYQAFRDVKTLFDPAGLMNPGKIIDTPSMTENLRYNDNYRVAEVPNTFHYRDQGGFQLAVEQCNGVGACRKLGAGTMCPSYMATRDEEHSTRGRANALRLAMTNQVKLNHEALTSDRLHQTLDLCLSCKACKSECPNSVDMARLKSDFLQMYHDRHGTPLATRMIAHMPRMARLVAGPLAPLVNAVQRSRPFKWFMAKYGKVDPRRSLPAFAREPLPQWFRHREKRSDARNGRVVLFDDTYANYFEPRIGRAAVNLLESCGYEVILASAGCCQRTRISSGLLRAAKEDGERTFQKLDAYAKAGLPILVLEPSCASALTDDLPDLLDDADLAQRVAKQVKMIDVFLAEELGAGRLDQAFTTKAKRILLHGHCHQKSLYGTEAMRRILDTIPDLTVNEVDAGCCGMAGAFGYEKYDLSMKVGEDRLFPAIRKRDDKTIPVACGFSCRHQVRDACGVMPKHWVEVLRTE